MPYFCVNNMAYNEYTYNPIWERICFGFILLCVFVSLKNDNARKHEKDERKKLKINKKKIFR